MKATSTEHMKAKCGHVDVLGYLLHTYCKACSDNGHRDVVRPTRIWATDNDNDKVKV
jgi:hypothetical protein